MSLGVMSSHQPSSLLLTYLSNSHVNFFQTFILESYRLHKYLLITAMKILFQQLKKKTWGGNSADSEFLSISGRFCFHT